MKLYKKTVAIMIRVNELTAARLDNLTNYLELDRSDMIRMFINNALKYWEEQKVKQDLKGNDPDLHGYTNQELDHIRKVEVMKAIFNKPKEQPTTTLKLNQVKTPKKK